MTLDARFTQMQQSTTGVRQAAVTQRWRQIPLRVPVATYGESAKKLCTEKMNLNLKAVFHCSLDRAMTHIVCLNSYAVTKRCYEVGRG